jgi:hypothetical protein
MSPDSDSTRRITKDRKRASSNHASITFLTHYSFAGVNQACDVHAQHGEGSSVVLRIRQNHEVLKGFVHTGRRRLPKGQGPAGIRWDNPMVA